MSIFKNPWGCYRDWVFAVLIVGILVGFLGAIFGISFFFENLSCSQYSQETVKPTKYRFLTGCYVFVNGEWVSTDQYVVNSETSR